MSFKDLNIKEELIAGLEKQAITKTIGLQEDIIKALIEKKNLIAKSKTGSGKTLSYLLPIFTQADSSLRSTQAIIITPTHELAAQVYAQARLLNENSGLNINSALIIGKANIQRQIETLKTKPQIVIGSAGRILDLIKKRKIQAHTVKTVIIDEADRMLDDLNIEGVKAVVKTTLKERQLAFFSASMNEKTVSRAKEMAQEVFMISEKKENILPDTIEHCYIITEKRDKIIELRKIIHSESPKRVIVFINNPNELEVTVEKLNYHGLKADGIYGMADKNERKAVLDAFRQGRINILVSSDISARGLDIEDVTHVINLDIAEDPVFYLHRAGRTGRTGKNGISICLVTEYEKRWIRRYEKELDILFKQKEMSYGKLTDVSVKAQPSKKPLSAYAKADKDKKSFKPKRVNGGGSIKK